MRITVLSDNLPARGLEAEWGLSLYLEYQGHALLLDTGASDLFARNAEALGLDLGAVAFGVLSHAHWDHANGMDAFFARNPSAPFYLQGSCGEVCFDHAPGLWRYEGPKRGLLDRFAPRLRYVTGAFSPLPGVHLLPHTTPGLARRGAAAGMFCLRAGQWVPDDFSHEQTLLLETPRGLVLLSSCCHAGADTIIREVQAAFPGRPIQAIVGGFHLYETPDQEVRALARRLRDTGVAQILTGHCTGERGFALLREELGAQVAQFSTGLVVEL